MPIGNDPLVSVCIITYNQERFIAQAIESVIGQQCNFKYELIIGEDCSKDRTREIVRSYADKYPEIIVPLFPEKNQGPLRNGNNCFMRTKGKYIAFLEGDDYWTDLHKLQRQFDFMEANPDFSMCFTRSEVIDENGKPLPADMFPVITKDEFTFEDIVMTERVFIPSATAFYKNVLPKPMPQFFLDAISGDIAVHMLVGDHGKFKCLPCTTAIYREHAGGISKNERQLKEGYRKLFKLYVDANEYLGYRHDKVIRQRLSQMSKTKLIYGSKDMKGIEKLKYVMQNAPDYFKYADKSIKEVVYYFAILFFPSLVKLKK